MDENQALIPVEQQTITFYGKPKIPEAEWDKVENWFKVQIERGHKK